MLDDKMRAESEQIAAALAEMPPALWFQLYDGCQKVGFTDDQAFELVKMFVRTRVGPGEEEG